MEKRRKKKKPFFIKGTYFDYTSLFLILFLTFFGLVMVYSVSSNFALVNYGDAGYFAKRQFVFALVGIIVMIGCSFIRYQWFMRNAKMIMAATLLLSLAVIVMGSAANGSKRWLSLGPVSFQPSELAKVGLVIYTSFVCTVYSSRLKDWISSIILFMPQLFCICMIVFSNLSTAIICAGITVCIWVVCTPRIKWLVWIMLVGIIGGILAISIHGYRSDRIQGWLHPDPVGDGYQTMQALYALGTGGLFGKGLGQSVQKINNIPEAHNDMIFSVICEELGIVGALCLIAAFIMLIWRFKFIAEGAPDRFGSLMVVGVMAHICLQSIINISVVTNVIPNTGVPLPFVSYGGSSLVFLFIEMGLVLGVSRQIVPIHLVEKEKRGIR